MRKKVQMQIFMLSRPVGIVVPVCLHRASVPICCFPNPNLITSLLRRTGLSHFPVVNASSPILPLLPPDRAAQLPVLVVERPGPVRMAHAQGGNLPGLLRPGPHSLTVVFKFSPLLVCLGPANLRVSLWAPWAVLRALRAGGVAAESASDASPPAPARGGIACRRGCAALSRDTKCRDY
jgi:hypothetical protein